MAEKFNLKLLAFSVAISVSTGAISSYLTAGNRLVYEQILKPPLSPPGFVFPAVWTVLFIVMGVSAYFIYREKSKWRKPALWLYAVNLAVNFFWSIIFFNMQNFLFAFIWLCLLWVIIAAMVVLFYLVDKKAALLQLPYLVWVTFAGYLNLGIYLLNK